MTASLFNVQVAQYYRERTLTWVFLVQYLAIFSTFTFSSNSLFDESGCLTAFSAHFVSRRSVLLKFSWKLRKPVIELQEITIPVEVPSIKQYIILQRKTQINLEKAVFRQNYQKITPKTNWVIRGNFILKLTFRMMLSLCNFKNISKIEFIIFYSETIFRKCLT